MENLTPVAENKTSPSLAGLELVSMNTEVFKRGTPTVSPGCEECKEDLYTLDLLCIEIVQFLHQQLQEKQSKFIKNNRG